MTEKIVPTEDLLKLIPLGRVGKPEEIAATVDFLFSDGAAYITGQDIVVDGGWLAKGRV